MARGQLTFFRSEEIERIHLASIRMLEEIGIRMRSESVAKVLEEAGGDQVEGREALAHQ